eukprot:6198656-Pleurochrysis_carterae.AAC.1
MKDFAFLMRARSSSPLGRTRGRKDVFGHAQARTSTSTLNNGQADRMVSSKTANSSTISPWQVRKHAQMRSKRIHRFYFVRL